MKARELKYKLKSEIDGCKTFDEMLIKITRYVFLNFKPRNKPLIVKRKK